MIILSLNNNVKRMWIRDAFKEIHINIKFYSKLGKTTVS